MCHFDSGVLPEKDPGVGRSGSQSKEAMINDSCSAAGDPLALCPGDFDPRTET